MKIGDFDLVREDVPHNFSVLAKASLPENHDAVLMLRITDEDAERGHAGKIHSCAAAICAKSFWGNGCVPSVMEERDGVIYLSVSDRDTRLRYTAEMGILRIPGGFDPEQYDRDRANGRPVRGGPVVLRNVTADLMPAEKYPEHARKPHARHVKNTRPARKWNSSSVPMKGAPMRREVIDVLNGDAPSTFNKKKDRT